MLSNATLKRRLASISRARGLAGLASPVASALVRATLRGIRRIHGRPQHQAAPLTADLLREIVPRIGSDTKGLRDRALLLLGFAGAFRRSELIGIDVEHLEFTQQGIVVTLPCSKTDPFGTGRRVGIPIVSGPVCPIRAVPNWVKHAEIAHGPVFRPVNGHGAVLRVRLSTAAVSVVVKRAVSLVGRDAKKFSGHSLRAGFVTSAVMARVSTAVIREQTGHSRESTPARYARPDSVSTANLPAWLLCVHDC